MKWMQLTRGMATQLDDGDFAEFSAWRWHASGSSHVYARRNTDINGVSVSLYLHRLITTAPPELDVDHINGDTLDNRRENLRVVTTAENLWNREKTTRWLGVCAIKGGRWRATIDLRGRKLDCGIYPTPEAAALVRDYAAETLRGPIGPRNFPNADYSGIDPLSLSPSLRREIHRRA